MMDPKKPSQFWRVVNIERKAKCKSVVKPIVRDDGTLAVTDEEINLRGNEENIRERKFRCEGEGS